MNLYLKNEDGTFESVSIKEDPWAYVSSLPLFGLVGAWMVLLFLI